MKHCVGCNYAFVMKLCSVGGGQCIDGQLITVRFVLCVVFPHGCCLFLLSLYVI